MTENPRSTATHTEVVDWFDTVLPGSWARRYDGTTEWAPVSFHRYDDADRRITITVDDGTIKITEYAPGTWLIQTETTLSGDARIQAPRALTLVGFGADA